jgi:hypothetical protein
MISVSAQMSMYPGTAGKPQSQHAVKRLLLIFFPSSDSDADALASNQTKYSYALFGSFRVYQVALHGFGFSLIAGHGSSPSYTNSSGKRVSTGLSYLSANK